MAIIKENMNAKQYMNAPRDIADSYYFHQDNDPKHANYIMLLHYVKNLFKTLTNQ